MSLSVVCVETGNYLGRGVEYVQRLREGVAKNLTVPHRFYCLSDRDHEGAERLEAPKWPGWWPKLGLFRPGQFDGLVLYFDLDTFILGDITRLASYNGEFAILRDFFRPQIGQSAVMLWRPDAMENVWRAAENLKPRLGERMDFWLAPMTPFRQHLQDVYPGMFVSYKVHASKHKPAEAAVCCFHGKPRPHEAAGWARDHWITTQS